MKINDTSKYFLMTIYPLNLYALIVQNSILDFKSIQTEKLRHLMNTFPSNLCVEHVSPIGTLCVLVSLTYMFLKTFDQNFDDKTLV